MVSIIEDLLHHHCLQLPGVAKAIWDSLVDEFLPLLKAADWQEIALGFKERCNFPNWHHKVQAPVF